MSASYFKNHLEIDNGERIKTKIDDKPMDCPFLIAPSLFLTINKGKFHIQENLSYKFNNFGIFHQL